MNKIPHVFPRRIHTCGREEGLSKAILVEISQISRKGLRRDYDGFSGLSSCVTSHPENWYDGKKAGKE